MKASNEAMRFKNRLLAIFLIGREYISAPGHKTPSNILR